MYRFSSKTSKSSIANATFSTRSIHRVQPSFAPDISASGGCLQDPSPMSWSFSSAWIFPATVLCGLCIALRTRSQSCANNAAKRRPSAPQNDTKGTSIRTQHIHPAKRSQKMEKLRAPLRPHAPHSPHSFQSNADRKEKKTTPNRRIRITYPFKLAATCPGAFPSSPTLPSASSALRCSSAAALASAEVLGLLMALFAASVSFRSRAKCGRPGRRPASESSGRRGGVGAGSGLEGGRTP